MFIRVLLLLLFMPAYLLANTNTYSSIINVRIYAGHTINDFTFKAISGSYNIVSGNRTLTTISGATICRLNVENRKISIRAGEAVFTNLESVRFETDHKDGVFNIKPAGRAPARNYDDNLTVTLEGGNLKLINNIDIEKYVAGVVQAEGGIMQNNEFFKMQAVACRTYVLRNIRRHFREGFHVCDRVHCQVYHGKSSKKEIVEMTEQTRSFVIVDKNLNFITAAFHANCGGETVNSENVWSLPSTYMKSVKDTFCVNGRHAFWEFKISTDAFLDYLKRSFNFPIEDSSMVINALMFNQDSGRRVFFLDLPNIHLKEIREGLKLKSTFFSIYNEGDSLVFKGRGFGHGVGLCQEGAMHMINAGYKYDEVIKYYFTDVYIISYEDVLKSLK